MKIEIQSIDTTQFMVHPHFIGEEVIYLIQPQHIGCKWTQQNKFLRSTVVNNDGDVISIGFPKFTNWGENPEHFPTPDSLDGCVCTEKLDGSLLIVSKYKGNIILRTRGTVDASKLDNGDELEVFKQTILPRLDGDSDTWKFSILFEWVSPKQRIVLSYGDKPDWYLVGVVYHSDGSLESQDNLDQWALQHGLKRPQVYSFNSISDMIELVSSWKGKEGIVVYSKNGQVLHKLKSDDYLIKHRLKDEFCNFERVLDFYIAVKCPDYQEFYNKIAEIVDFETAEELRADISKCVDAKDEVLKILDDMQNFVTFTLLSLGDPKDKKIRGQMAQKVLSSYGNTNRASFVFGILDGRELDKDGLKKLYYQVLKK